MTQIGHCRGVSGGSIKPSREHRCFRRYATASLAAFTGRALMIFRAGLALNIAGSFVNGLMPCRSFVAGFLITTNLANPGTKKAPVFLSSLWPKTHQATFDDAFDVLPRHSVRVQIDNVF